MSERIAPPRADARLDDIFAVEDLAVHFGIITRSRARRSRS
jgi:hypothetical protein